MSHRECTTLSGCCCLLNGREEVVGHSEVTHKSQRFFTRNELIYVSHSEFI